MSYYLKRRKRVLRKTLVGVCLFIVGSICTILLAHLSRRFLSFSSTANLILPILLMTILSLLLYKPLDKAVTQLFKNYLFRKRSYAHITLMNLAEELSTTLDLQELGNLVVNTFGEVLHLKTVALLVPNIKRKYYEIVSAYGWPVSEAKHVSLAENSQVMQLINDNGPHVLVRNRALRMHTWQDANHLAEGFDYLRAGWVIPLMHQSELTGIIAFGAKSPETAFDEVDFQFFREFAALVSRCAKNALAVRDLKAELEELRDVQSQMIQSSKVAAIEQLATGIAHEIHNPLTIISGKAQVLLLKKDASPMDPKLESVLKTIVKQTKRAADITRKLLMFSQSSGSPKDSLSLGQVLDDTIALISYQTSLDGIEITKSVDANLPLFYGNIHELREVFLNLILNAVQSIKQQGKIHVDINYHEKESCIEIQIADSGRGIPEENIDKLFNPFFSTRQEGTGLGLFISQQIVHRYGGSIRAESKKGLGSLFKIQLPCEGSLRENRERENSDDIHFAGKSFERRI